ncbi:hypothetical protein CAY35_06030 [Pseudoglutamicibacter cumminsii]|uniref:Uncharacterized protein n=1 Tax=Pseudoglutamicibacter cumminsii TaxID=156979 RepID=A0ABX5L4V4_9MICC|nr:hypothetical protein CAY35_06030 [Pseudoglutamicibacter cumminsii]
MSYQQQTPAAHESNGGQYPRHGERRSQHPRHGGGADRIQKNSSPVSSSLPDSNTGSKGESIHTRRSSFTLAEQELLRQGEHNRGWWEGYFYGVRETTARLAPMREAERQELYLDAWWDAMHVRISTQHRKTVELALTAAFSPRCYNCGAGRGDTFEGVNA